MSFERHADLELQIRTFASELNNIQALADLRQVDLDHALQKNVHLQEKQAEVEAENYAKARGLTEVPLHYIILKRRNAGIEKAWVIQDLTQWLAEKH